MLGRRALHVCWRWPRDAYDLAGRSLGLTPVRALPTWIAPFAGDLSHRRPIPEKAVQNKFGRGKRFLPSLFGGHLWIQIYSILIGNDWRRSWPQWWSWRF
jgi:hypothetical protein